MSDGIDIVVDDGGLDVVVHGDGGENPAEGSFTFFIDAPASILSIIDWRYHVATATVLSPPEGRG